MTGIIELNVSATAGSPAIHEKLKSSGTKIMQLYQKYFSLHVIIFIENNNKNTLNRKSRTKVVIGAFARSRHTSP